MHMHTPLPVLLLAIQAVLVERPLGAQQAAVPRSTCYALQYSSIEQGVERQELPLTLRFHPGVARGRLTPDDTTPVWQGHLSWADWRRIGDSLELRLSNGQFELLGWARTVGDTLRGSFEYRTDVVTPRSPHAFFVAVRVPCP